MKKSLALLLVLILAVGMFAGCGGGEEVVEESSAAAQQESSQETSQIAKVREMPEVSGDVKGQYTVIAKYGSRLYYELGGGNSGGICIIDKDEVVDVYQVEMYGVTVWGLVSYTTKSGDIKTGWLILEGEDIANWQ